MAALAALFPDSFRSHKEWDLEDIPRPREGLWRWIKATNVGSIGGACVGLVMHFRKHPLDWSKVRTVSFVQGMDRRNRWYPPLLGYWRSFNFQRLPMRRELLQSMGLWGARCGSLFMVSYGLETFLCVLSMRPYHTSWGISFFSGFMGGFVFSLSDIVPRKTRMVVSISYGCLFCLAAMYDGIPQEVSPGEQLARQEMRNERKKQFVLKNEQPRGISPREQMYQMRLKQKMEKLYNAADDPGNAAPGTHVGDTAYGNQYVFSFMNSVKDRLFAGPDPLDFDGNSSKMFQEMKKESEEDRQSTKLGSTM